MKKTYWWRTSFFLMSIIIFGYGYVASNGPGLDLCHSENGRQSCLLYYDNSFDPIMFMVLSLLIISPFLFFITDKIFLKWLRFAAVWVILSITLIAITPEHPSGGIMSGPDREMVSIWLGGLFVILSLGKIAWDVLKEKRLK